MKDRDTKHGAKYHKTNVHYMPFQGSILICLKDVGRKKDQEWLTTNLEARLLTRTYTPSSARALLTLHLSMTKRRPSTTFQAGTEA